MAFAVPFCNFSVRPPFHNSNGNTWMVQGKLLYDITCKCTVHKINYCNANSRFFTAILSILDRSPFLWSS